MSPTWVLLLIQLSTPITSTFLQLELHTKRNTFGRNLLGVNDSLIRSLYGSVREQGYYCVVVRLGSPPHPFCLITDTGSTMTYIPCSSCNRKCGRHLNKPFKPQASHTAQIIKCGQQECECDQPQCGCLAGQCSYERHYLEGSQSSGILIQDMVTLNSYWKAKAIFGCELSESGLLYHQQADGVLGLGKTQNSIIKQLSESLSLNWEFSLCYGGFQGGGAIVIGDPSPLIQIVQYTPLIKNTKNLSYFTIQMESIIIEDRTIQGDFDLGYGVILDSGSTFTYFPTVIYQQFIDTINILIDGKLDQVTGEAQDDICFGNVQQNETTHIFPVLIVNFLGIQIQLQPVNYLFYHGSKKDCFCVGVFDNGKKGSVLGGTLFRDVFVHYDLEGERIGMRSYQCSGLSQGERIF
eukprot:TRINITY_DN16697_c0_g1_i2.p1 TRINITY_DN16697_c0_g1~~TRINITY_DN16697_c0_g1_i2.p1  ORF type:complete len:408 (+),score=13.42 TRINITY_DN16697_c0_g1_i2:94-1317(+)